MARERTQTSWFAQKLKDNAESALKRVQNYRKRCLEKPFSVAVPHYYGWKEASRHTKLEGAVAKAAKLRINGDEVRIQIWNDEQFEWEDYDTELLGQRTT